MAKGIKYSSQQRQTLQIGPGQTLGRGQAIGQTHGDRRKLAKSGISESPNALSRYQRFKNFLGLQGESGITNPNDGFVEGSTKTFLGRMGDGYVNADRTLDDKALCHICQSISAGHKTGHK